MELETIRAVIGALVAAYVFLITIWTVALPSIRENDGEGVGTFVNLSLVIAAGLMTAVVSALMGGVDSGDLGFDLTAPVFFIMLAGIAPFIIIGFALVLTLIDLSLPKK